MINAYSVTRRVYNALRSPCLRGWAAHREVDQRSAHGRLDEIDAFLSGETQASRVTADLLSEAAALRYRLGDRDIALDQANQALAYYREADNALGAALVLGKIADILASRGELDEALRIRREEELPVYERLGDVRALLVGRANLAIGLLNRGAGGGPRPRICSAWRWRTPAGWGCRRRDGSRGY